MVQILLTNVSVLWYNRPIAGDGSMPPSYFEDTRLCKCGEWIDLSGPNDDRRECNKCVLERVKKYRQKVEINATDPESKPVDK